MEFCKVGHCYTAVYMLLYVCQDSVRELYKLMLEWQLSKPDGVVDSLAYTVFEKWLESGTAEDMEHLLKGPKELDHILVGFLKDSERPDLAATIQVSFLPLSVDL